MRCIHWLSICLMMSLAIPALLAQERPVLKGVTSPRLTRLLSELQSGNHDAIPEFWLETEKQGTPLIELIPGDATHVWVTFLWRATQPVKNVLVVSGLTNGSYGRDVLSQNLMSPLPATDIWYRTYRVRSDARFTYQLSVDDSLVPSEEEDHPDEREHRFRPDPLNPRHAASTDPDSFVELPKAPVEDEWVQKSGVPKGELKELQIRSRILNNERKIYRAHSPVIPAWLDLQKWRLRLG
jgi:Domain of unknown function (DUF3327)